MKNNRKPTLNSRLRGARVELGWSQEELAVRMDTTSVTISRWENGSAFPNPHFRQKLCEVFSKTPVELGLLPPASAGTRAGDIPITRNPFFMGRESLLALLHKRLSTAKVTMLTQPQALFGLGGIGKTQTAAEYAYRYGQEYTHVFWMLAATRETLAADFVRLAELLDLPEKDQQDQSQMVVAVKHWLATHEGWLLILDNADDLPLAQEFLPRNHKGYILFTTRSQAAGAISASVEVERLTIQEGTLLLLHWTKLLDRDASLDEAQAEDRAAAERIVQEMDGLPLALVQAGAYVEESGCGLEDYLRLYATHRKEVLAWHSRFMLDYPETVATTWLLSFQRIEQQSSVAADLLRLCAFLAPDAIPEELLSRGASAIDATPGAEPLDQFKLNSALDVLGRYSLVRRNRNTHMLNIHRLVQIVLKDSLDQTTQRTWAERTVRAVNAAFPEAESRTGENQQYYLQYYLPHVQECATLITHYHLHSSEAEHLLYRAGELLHFYGFYSQSQSLHQQALEIRQQLLGFDHPTVAESLNALGVLSRIQGNYEQAEEFYRQALTIREKTLGAEHLATAISLNNLGVLYRTQGKYEQAEPLFHRALIISQRSLGPEHPDILYSFINLAKFYLEQHKYEHAEPLARQALTICERVLEPGHHIFAQVLSLLARISYEQRNYEQAEMLWKRALSIVEKTYGREHPSTAERLNNLAELYVAQGRLTEAESLCRRALRICEISHGSEHADTIAYRQHLSSIVSKKEAEQGVGHQPPAPPGR